MFFEQLLFFIAGLGALAGATGVVLLRNPFYAVLSLVSHLISLALLFLLLRAAFIAAAQVVVYASAVIVLYLFVVSYVGGTDQGEEEARPADFTLAGSLGPLFAGAVFIEIAIAVIGSGLGALDTTGPEVGPGFGSPGEIGELLLTRFLIPFEAASFLLLLAAVAAIVLARKRRGLESDESQVPAVSVGEIMRGDVATPAEAPPPR